VSRGRPKDPQVAWYVEQILTMRPDTSVFVPDATSDQLEFLRKPVREAGAGIEIVRVENDEIYCKPGVRLFRREGEYDQL
jgi:hypothetical protein